MDLHNVKLFVSWNLLVELGCSTECWWKFKLRNMGHFQKFDFLDVKNYRLFAMKWLPSTEMKTKITSIYLSLQRDYWDMELDTSCVFDEQT